MIYTTIFGTSTLVDYIMIMFKFGDIFHTKTCTDLSTYLSNFSYNAF